MTTIEHDTRLGLADGLSESQFNELLGIHGLIPNSGFGYKDSNYQYAKQIICGLDPTPDQYETYIRLAVKYLGL